MRFKKITMGIILFATLSFHVSAFSKEHEQMYTKKAEIEYSFDDINNLDASIRKAAELEEKNQIDEALAIYEIAGKQCMDLHYQNTAFGHELPALIAAFCFEKGDQNRDLAKNAYELVVRDYYEIFKDLYALSENDKSIENGFKFIFKAPITLEMSIASLKLEKKDLFAELICDQMNDFTMIYNTTDEYGDDFIDIEDPADTFFIAYFKALKNIADKALKNDSKLLAKIKKTFEAMPPYFNTKNDEIYSLQKVIEADLYDILLSTENFTVNHKIKLLTDGHVIRP